MPRGLGRGYSFLGARCPRHVPLAEPPPSSTDRALLRMTIGASAPSRQCLSESLDDLQLDSPAGESRRRDPQTDLAKRTLMVQLFDTQPDGVFYARQIEVLFERRFFHWITARALDELVAEGMIASAKEALGKETQIRFFWSRRCRYWKRRARRVAEADVRRWVSACSVCACSVRRP
jgi:hypothetical protein